MGYLNPFRFFCFALALFSLLSAKSQNENSKWYFGAQAGLDFMSSPPLLLSNGVMAAPEGCSSIADGAGNLLFYTEGTTIWNATHQIMANGSGLQGSMSSCQAALIVKQPGNSNVYYVFCTGPHGTGNLYYSVVDMNLAAGMGSVTVKNVQLLSGCAEKLCAAKHCNGTDYWVLGHAWNSSTFLAYQLSATGVNTTAVVSNQGTYHGGSGNAIGGMKISPGGKKLALSLYGYGCYELFDFNSSTGQVSNPLILSYDLNNAAYDCEFSPDGTKLYGSLCNLSNTLYQWNLCAPSPSDVVASKLAVGTSTALFGGILLAPDNKLYVARYNQKTLGVINAPNALGNACNFVDLGFSVAPKSCLYNLPNFPARSSLPSASLSPFVYTINCTGAQFIAPLQPSSLTPCQQSTLPNIGQLQWDFGDPVSGSANSSSLANPGHTFSTHGNYTVNLTVFYSCGGGSLNLQQTISTNTTTPVLSVSGPSALCAGEAVSYTAQGATTYSWSTGHSSSIVNLIPTQSGTISVTGFGTHSTCVTQQVLFVIAYGCLGADEQNIDARTVLVFPNPFTDKLTLDLPKRQKIKLWDICGKLCLETVFESGESILDLQHLNPGFYLLEVGSGADTHKYKLIKQEFFH